MIRTLLLCMALLIAPFSLSHADSGKGKEWALYSWLDDHGRWNYSLVHGTDKHPDGDEIKEAATTSLEKIKTRMALLERDSIIELNPLPVLNMEMILPPANTLKEFERVCTNSALKLIRFK